MSAVSYYSQIKSVEERAVDLIRVPAFCEATDALSLQALSCIECTHVRVQSGLLFAVARCSSLIYATVCSAYTQYDLIEGTIHEQNAIRQDDTLSEAQCRNLVGNS